MIIRRKGNQQRLWMKYDELGEKSIISRMELIYYDVRVIVQMEYNRRDMQPKDCGMTWKSSSVQCQQIIGELATLEPSSEHMDTVFVLNCSMANTRTSGKLRIRLGPNPRRSI